MTSPLVRLSKLRLSSSMPKTIPASGVLKAAATPAAAPTRISPGCWRGDMRPIANMIEAPTFAADRAAAEQPEKRQQNFPYSDADRDEPSPRALIGESARGDRLRNAATLRIAKKPVRQENREHEAQRCDDEGRIAPARHQEVEGVLRLVGQEGEHHGRRANRDTAEEEDRAALPAGPGDPKHPPTALGKQQFLETRMARGKGHSRSWDRTVRAGSAL